MILKIKYGTIK